MTADDVIGKYLIAKEDRPVTLFPNGPQTGLVTKGTVVGPVYSYVVRGNDIFWEFDVTVPGNPPGSFWSLHRPEYWKLSTTAGGTPVTVTTGIFAKKTINLYFALIGLAGIYLLTKK